MRLKEKECRFHLSVGPFCVLLAAEMCEVFILADQRVTPSSHSIVHLTSITHHHLPALGKLAQFRNTWLEQLILDAV